MENELRKKIVDAIKTVFDPEIPVNIYDLGLIYDIQINEENDVAVKMTLTTINCPEAQTLPVIVRSKIMGIEGIRSANVELVWQPPWDTSKMSEVARMALNIVS